MIDLVEFITSLMSIESGKAYTKADICKALLDQGLKFENGKLCKINAPIKN